jgi:hypothetical protein
MVNMFLMNSNLPDNWDFTGVEVIKGIRQVDSFVDRYTNSDLIKPISISENDDGSEFLQNVYKYLNLDEKTIGNTITVFTHPDYLIQIIYRSDLDFKNSTDFNYLGTVLNLEGLNIFGKCIYFKISNKKVIDITLKEILSLIVNFYYLQTYKLKDGIFEEISFNNFYPEIQHIFKGYTIKEIDDWEIYTDDKNSNIEKFSAKKDNNINDFNNLIFLKKKQKYGDIWQAKENVAEQNNDGDLRGLYCDLDIEFIKRIFFI